MDIFKAKISAIKNLIKIIPASLSLPEEGFFRRKPKKTKDRLPIPGARKALSKQEQEHSCASYTKLKLLFRDIGRVNGIIEILGRDFLTAMPEGACASRLGQVSYLYRRIHEDLISDDVAELIDEAKAHEYAHRDDWDAWDAANLREMERFYRNFCHVDPDLMEQKARLSFEGRRRHIQALKDGNVEDSLDFLQQQIDLHCQIAECRSRANNETGLYQSVIAEYMPDVRIEDIDRWFKDFSKELDRLTPLILKKQEGRTPPVPLHGTFGLEAQRCLNKSLLQMIGFDFDRGGLYETGHNPVEGGTPEDTRLVIKNVDPSNFLDSMKSVLHEGGHGIYIQGLPRSEWRYQPVAMDLGAAVHESQALLIDMIIGRMPEFFEYLSPRAEGLFQAIGDSTLTPQNLFKLRTWVKPSVNRRVADEVTYFRHIQLRHEIEKNLFEGKIRIKDIPEIWDEASQKYVGIKPSSPNEGFLQDVHWFVGKFGYFPSYAIGMMMAAQTYKSLKSEIGDIPSLVKKGDLIPVKEWLNKKIHSNGRLFKWDELIRRTTGKSLDSAALAEHLSSRYLD